MIYPRGVLLFAYNNSAVDYIALARVAAVRIKQYLGVDTCIVTDDHSVVDGFDHYRYLSHNDISAQARTYISGSGAFRNQNRAAAFYITPFEETLIIDADYWICSSELNKVWNDIQPLLIPHTSVGLDGRLLANALSPTTIPAVWATLIYFRKAPIVETIFGLTDYISRNWEYYSGLYGISSSLYRNDFAFAIALHAMAGYVPNSLYQMPITLVTATERCTVHATSGDAITFVTESNQLIPLKAIDVHIINKSALQELIND